MVYIQQDISFALGYFIPAVFMVIAVIIFVAARKRYVPHYPGGESCYIRWGQGVHEHWKRVEKSHCVELVSFFP